MKVLIPVDGSDQSQYTLKEAVRFLDKKTSQIYLLTVKVPVAAEVPWVLIDDEETILRILSQAKQDIEALGFTVAKTEFVTFHDPAGGICNYADDIQADLILIGSHGFQGLAKFLLGSVSEQVFKKAKQPVVIVRNDKSHSVEISHFEAAGLESAKS